jgi:hypothetical protein
VLLILNPNPPFPTLLLQVCAQAPSPLLEACSSGENPTAYKQQQQPMKKQVSDKTNSHEIIDELTDVDWKVLCSLSPTMATRAQGLAKRYGYAVDRKNACQ